MEKAEVPEGFRVVPGLGWIAEASDGRVTVYGSGRWVKAGGATVFEPAPPAEEVPREMIAELDAIGPQLNPLQFDLLALMRRAHQREEIVGAWQYAEALSALGHGEVKAANVRQNQRRLKKFLPPHLWLLFAPPERGLKPVKVVRGGLLRTLNLDFRFDHLPETVGMRRTSLLVRV